MEVMIPSPAVSAPSSTSKRDYYQFSAPTSPSRLSQFFDEFHATGDESGGALASAVAFSWEQKPGTPKLRPAVRINDNGDDFAFDVSQDWETASLSAEELFDGGVIKPLKPPPRLAAGISENMTSPRKKSMQTRKIIQGAFLPRNRNRETDPFAVAARQATKSAATAAEGPQRGREKEVNLSKSSSRRAARSLSPLRDTQYPWEEEEEEKEQHHKANNSALSVAPKGHKKWRLKDFFLFRSASEGRATEKDPLKKYSAAAFRYSSFRAIESPGSGAGSRRRGRVSAHELHYTVNRAVSEDLKKKTFLPYKQGILGRLAFNPAVHALANGFGFSRK